MAVMASFRPADARLPAAWGSFARAPAAGAASKPNPLRLEAVRHPPLNPCAHSRCCLLQRHASTMHSRASMRALLLRELPVHELRTQLARHDLQRLCNASGRRRRIFPSMRTWPRSASWRASTACSASLVALHVDEWCWEEREGL